MDRSSTSTKNNSEIITPDTYRGICLDKLTSDHVTMDLYNNLVEVIDNQNFTKEDNDLIKFCLHLGLNSHATDRRANGDKYNDHLLEATMILVEQLKIKDVNIIAATPLHDTLEDHPLSMIRSETNNPKNKYYLRFFGKLALSMMANAEVAEIVDDVTNPILETGQDKQIVYEKHCQSLVNKSINGRIVKLADFLSNTNRQMKVPEEKRISLDQRYVNLFQLHISGLYLPDSLIQGETRETVAQILSTRHKETLGRIATRNVATF